MFRTILVLSLCFCSAYATAQDLSPYLCDKDPTVHATKEIPVDLKWVTLTATAANSSGVVEALNNSVKMIQHYLIIMEFFDGRGRYLFSSPIYSTDNDQNIKFDVPFRAWLTANWPGGNRKPVPPKSTFNSVFNSHLISLTCPALVRVSFAWLKYDDGSEFKYVSPELNISSSPAEPAEMAISDRKGAMHWTPLTVSGDIVVDAKGHVRILDADFNANGFQEWLEREFSRWNFTPPWIKGKPGSQKLPFLFILGDTVDTRVQIETLKKRGLGGALLLLHFDPYMRSAR